MIVAQFVKAVRVQRGYEVDIPLNMSFEEFQALSLGPGAGEKAETERRPKSSAVASGVLS